MNYLLLWQAEKVMIQDASVSFIYIVPKSHNLRTVLQSAVTCPESTDHKIHGSCIFI